MSVPGGGLSLSSEADAPPSLGSGEAAVRLFPPTFRPWCPPKTGRAVAVLMSGGVDSSLAAARLREGGWTVLGLTMKVPVDEACDHPHPCCGTDAALVCKDLSIAHYFLDVTQAFEHRIIEPFRRGYREGRTPSPCVDCNTFLKFGAVWDLVERTFGITHLATGHYARVVRRPGRVFLARAADRTRDQSYFLYGVPPHRLPRLRLPLGELSKEEVRRAARRRRLRVAGKDDSMELCFAGEGDYRRALGRCPDRPGPIVDLAGKVIGRHRGIFHYTVGQRRGLGVAAGRPLYVVRILPEKNTLVVGTREDAGRRRVRAVEVNVLLPEALRPDARLYGKIRAVGEPAPCRLLEASDDAFAVEFDSPQFAPCPGQRLVVYDEEERVVGGGTIGPLHPEA